VQGAAELPARTAGRTSLSRIEPLPAPNGKPEVVKRWLPRASGTGLRPVLQAYIQVLGGSMGRLLLQALYFALLVNALSLADYGVFASALAASIIIANIASFGFTAPLFRAATTRQRLLPWYFGAFLVWTALTVPVSLGVAAAFHMAVMERYIALAPFLAIAVSEALLWPLIDTLFVLNAGLGRYAHASGSMVLGSAARTAAALLFALAGGGTVEHWAFVYLAANLLAVAACLLLFLPRVRPRWDARIMARRIPEAMSASILNLVQSVQIELDKLLILLLTNQTAAGVYALAMRIVDLTSTPVKSFFTIYTQTLLRRRAAIRDFALSLRVELGVVVVATGLFGGFILLVGIRPGLLGANIASAYPFLAGLFLIPAMKTLVDYHRELFFSANRLAWFAGIAAVLAVLKMPALALIVAGGRPLEGWIVPLNLLFVGLYAVSATLSWRLLFARTAAPARPAAVPAE
jgi:O-antigen/teichoic acid export membrane protein